MGPTAMKIRGDQQGIKGGVLSVVIHGLVFFLNLAGLPRSAGLLQAGYDKHSQG